MNKEQRLVLIISITASFIAFLDQSVVNVALPAITSELGGGLSTKQWVVDAYLVTLGALILAAGSLSDVFGQRKILAIGLIGFGVTSILVAAAPTALLLIIARALQGAAAALIVPSALALILSSFSGKGKSKAIGTWTAWTGIAFVIGPLLGGFLVDIGSWRLVFIINLVPIALALWLMKKLESPDKTDKHKKVDVKGAILAATGLGGTVYALIEGPRVGFGDPIVLSSLLLGITALAAFILHEKQATQPMLPLVLFKERNFSVGNLATVTIYAGLSLSTFLIVVFLQQVGGYSALSAGLALLPISLIMFALSPRFGSLSGKYGPRLFMTLGPTIAGIGFLLLLRVDQSAQYWSQVFPALLVFGFGLSATVAPLTSAVLSDIADSRSGVASAVNNAIARIAGLLAIASVGLFAGSTLDVGGFHNGVIVMAALLFIGGAISLIGIRNPSNN